MIDRNGWVSWMRREDGPAWKGVRYADGNACEGVVPHSAVGFAANNFRELNNPDRVGAWWWFNPYDGKAVQHYSLLTSLAMHSDTHANTHYVGWETEGGFQPVNEPWTDAQLATAIRFTEDFEEWRGLTLVREPAFARNVHEHREFTNTACPSGRNERYYAWLAGRGQPEEDEMTPEERQRLDEAIEGVRRANVRIDELTAKLDLTRREAATHSSLPHGGPRLPDSEVVTILRRMP